MTIEPRESRTSVAILKRMRPDHIEVQYLQGAVLNTHALAEVQHARRKLMGNSPTPCSASFRRTLTKQPLP